MKERDVHIVCCILACWLIIFFWLGSKLILFDSRLKVHCLSLSLSCFVWKRIVTVLVVPFSQYLCFDRTQTIADIFRSPIQMIALNFHFVAHIIRQFTNFTRLVYFVFGLHSYWGGHRFHRLEELPCLKFGIKTSTELQHGHDVAMHFIDWLLLKVATTITATQKHDITSTWNLLWPPFLLT